MAGMLSATLNASDRSSARLLTFLLLVAVLAVVWCAYALWSTPALMRLTTHMIPYDASGRRHLHAKSTGRKRILFWTPFFSHADFYFGFGHEPFVKAHCLVDRCETTSDKRLLNASDAVVFHIRDIVSIAELKEMSRRWRPSAQRWVFYLLESPTHSSKLVRQLPPALFNWTMTYRRDSDIVTAYGSVSPLRQPPLLSGPAYYQQILRKKTGVVAWLVSHCDTESKREKYVQELARHIEVETYGACGRPCPDLQCTKMIEEKYKFYLSFENSLCKDYITEKFFRPLSGTIVPIVYGSGNYDAVAPPHSFINTNNFASPQQLAAFLHKLDQNDTLYLEYFQWKAAYNVTLGMTRSFCDLCKKLHQDHEVKVYSSMKKWWVDDAGCATAPPTPPS